MTGVDAPDTAAVRPGRGDALTEGRAVASVRTYTIPARKPEPTSEGRPAAWAAGLAESYDLTVALAGLDLHVTAGKPRRCWDRTGPGRVQPLACCSACTIPTEARCRCMTGRRRGQWPTG